MNASKALRAGLLAAALAACSEFHLSAGSLDIGPDPAVPGDQVVATFLVSLLPTQPHTVIFLIDDKEHFRATSNEAPPIPYVIQLGDAADLIAEYGTGTHNARVEVRAEEENENARTQSVTFTLQSAAPAP
jgi:hypothetical protein